MKAPSKISFQYSLSLFATLLITACSTVPESSIYVRDKQLKCLAEAVHGEARGETATGKIFVGRVVLTRVKMGFGENICSVVYAKSQFAPRRDFGADSLRAAQQAQRLGANGVTHFHSYASKKNPAASFSNSRQCQFRTKIGAHWGFLCNENRLPASTYSR